eukprot:Sdes_comp18762_c0_seq1m9158
MASFGAPGSSVTLTRRPKNKRTKVILKFDENDRRDFLSGFRKRKTERRKVALEEKKKKEKELKLQEKKEKRDARNALLASHPDIEEFGKFKEDQDQIQYFEKEKLTTVTIVKPISFDEEQVEEN